MSATEDFLDNATIADGSGSYGHWLDDSEQPSSLFLFISKWILRVTCPLVIVLCPWANFKLIQLFQTRPFFRDSSAKWFIIFKAVFDTLYMLVSMPIIFSLTFTIDVIHRNQFTCKTISYLHYFADDLVPMMLTLLCLDRMLRMTCSCRFRTRSSLIVCIAITCILAIVDVHHIVRLQHVGGTCQKTYYGIWDYDFDLYYSLGYTCILWTIIAISSANMTVSICCDRVRRHALQKRLHMGQQPRPVPTPGAGISLPSNSDRTELMHDTDDFEDATAVTIELTNAEQRPMDEEKQDDAELQITVGVLITSAIFLTCNLPNFMIYVVRSVFNATLSSVGFFFIYFSLFPLLTAYTVSYFVFNHLLALCFRHSAA